MKKRQVNRLANKLMAAAVLFTQAVFLLAPVSFVAAQTALTIQFTPYPATISSGTVTFTATSNYSDAGVDFIVTGPQPPIQYLTTNHQSGSMTHSASWDTTGLKTGSYKVEVRASRASETASQNAFTTIQTAGSVPQSPLSISVALSGSQINVSWPPVSGATHYYMERSVNGGIFQYLSNQTTSSYQDSGITAGSRYAYRVQACASGFGCSTNFTSSNPIEYPIANTEPSTTTNFSLQFLSPSSNGVTVQNNHTFSISASQAIPLNNLRMKVYRGNSIFKFYSDGVNWSGSNPYNFSWHTADVENGQYEMEAEGWYNGSPFNSERRIIYVANATGSTTAQTSTNQTQAATTSPNYVINFFQPPSLLYASSSIMVETNFLADEVRFYPINNTNYFIGTLQPPSQSGIYRYSFKWDIGYVANGTYTINARAIKSSSDYYAPAISVSISKPIMQVDLTQSASTTGQYAATTSIIKQPATINFFQPANGATLNGWARLQASSYGPIRRVEVIKIKDGLTASLGDAILNSANNSWEFGWDTTKTADGDYTLQIFAWDEQNYKITGNKIIVRLANLPTTPKMITPPPVTAQEPGSTAQNLPLQPIKPMAPLAPRQETQPTEKQQPPLPTQNIKEILQIQAPIIDFLCQNVGINDPLKCDNFLSTDKLLDTKQIKTEQALPTECQNANIKNTNDCELLMRSEYVAFECKQAGLTTKAECREFMQSRFGRPAACARLSDPACQKLISQVILADFVDQQTIDQANGEVNEISGKYLELIQSEAADGVSRVTVKEDTATLSKIDSGFDAGDIKTIERILPFAKSEKRLNLLILPSTTDAEKSKMLVGANALIDSDADGLTDDIEVRLGTDKMNADTDGDGYSDGVEVRSGHNPSGTGELKTALKPMELAIVNKVKLEQPKLSGETRADILKIQRITNNRLASSTATSTATSELRLQGRALANDVVSLYIYSVMPIVVTVATDENGNWSYNLDKSLIDGKHEAYVVINDEAGKVKAKSAPFSFFVKEARAVSQNDFLGADFAVPDRTTEFTGWYISGSLLLIIVGLGGYLLYQKTRQKHITYSK